MECMKEFIYIDFYVTEDKIEKKEGMLTWKSYSGGGFELLSDTKEFCFFRVMGNLGLLQILNNWGYF